ncbi:hypothetical protein Taro_041980 [Colocasia esculenta]|uniref:Dirigent protein n=1 Tax=Colocasia esculenta TaxID=4460 RepID=A0A843X1L2_COLES|nr:hypothetical protein [Colocasia esculenta]
MSMIAWCRLLSILITIHRPICARPLDHALPPPPPLPPQPPRNTYQQISVFMSDVLGNGNLLPESSEPAGTNTQIPLPKPRGLFPPVGGVPLPKPSACVPVPVSGPGDHAGDQSASWFPYLPSLQALEVGAVTVVDEELREGSLSTAPLVGRARGVYVTIPEDPHDHMMAMTVKFADGEPAENSIRFFGIHRTGAGESHVAVIGGTGKYEGANGYATVKSVGSSNPSSNSGAGPSKKSLRVTVFLS